MKLSDSYDIPEDVARGPHSAAFAKFLSNWFGDTYAITHGELDLTFLEDLTTDERELAREMVRRNLKLGYTHIVEGVSALRDIEAVPTLRAMFDKETDESRRLTIAGVLWKLARDPVFLECLERCKASRTLGHFGLLKVLWLDDSRAVDFLIDLLPAKDREAPPWRLLKWLAFRTPLRPVLVLFGLPTATVTERVCSHCPSSANSNLVGRRRRSLIPRNSDYLLTIESDGIMQRFANQ